MYFVVCLVFHLGNPFNISVISVGSSYVAIIFLRPGLSAWYVLVSQDGDFFRPYFIHNQYGSYDATQCNQACSYYHSFSYQQEQGPE